MYQIIIISLLVILMLFGINQYRLLKELKRQKKIAEGALKAKAGFLSSMSHEIRTPLNTILGMDELILRESTESVIREYAKDIQDAGQTLLVVINDILDQSKAEAGKLVIIPAEYDISAMLSDLFHLIKFKAKEQEVMFDGIVEPSIPRKLWGDGARIKQILNDLLLNAVMNAQKGVVNFRVSMNGKKEVLTKNVGKPGEFVELHFEVECRENGISHDAVRGKLWEKLLTLMGSELHVRTDDKKRSIYSFDLIQRVVDETPISLTAGQKGDLDAFQAPDARLLVVDDNGINRKLFNLLLKATQMQITEASNGREAVELASKQYFDLIFMDHMMPEMDGITAMKKIKAMKDGPCANTPIIVLTANAIGESQEQYLKAGFDGFLPKPIASEQLLKTIRDMLRQGKRRTIEDKNVGSRKNVERVTEPEEIMTSDQMFPDIAGIDWKVAMMRLQDRKALDVVLGDFAKTIDQQADKLQAFREQLPQSMEDYRILVHGMKSASGSLGMLSLSGMAAMLEKAAAERDEDVINRLHDVFLKEWKGYKDKLNAYQEQVHSEHEDSEQGDKKTIDREVLMALFRMLSKAMEEMDIDGADEAVEKLSSVQMPSELDSAFEALKVAVTQLDQEGVAKILDEIYKVIS